MLQQGAASTAGRRVPTSVTWTGSLRRDCSWLEPSGEEASEVVASESSDKERTYKRSDGDKRFRCPEVLFHLSGRRPSVSKITLSRASLDATLTPG
jgi:hypothetical protein